MELHFDLSDKLSDRTSQIACPVLGIRLMHEAPNAIHCCWIVNFLLAVGMMLMHFRFAGVLINVNLTDVELQKD